MTHGIWVALYTAYVTQVSAQTKPPPSPSVQPLVAAEKRFLEHWALAWRASEADRHPVNYGARNAADEMPVDRFRSLHCHTRDPAISTARYPTDGNGIDSRRSAFAACPGWIADRSFDPESSDERVSIDFGLTANRVPAVSSSRQFLIALFDSAVTSSPANDWVIGQYVRFAVDQGDVSRAFNAVHRCRGTAWWCAALAGYVLTRRADIVAADSAFREATNAMPASERCDWTDVSALLDSLARRTYSKFSCAKRDSVNALIWWLSDPLYIEPANERRAEHFARKVLGMLHSASDRDERFGWTDTLGGDARRELVIRYGWPSYIYWGGAPTDSSHRDYMLKHLSAWDPPYTSFEYTRGRQHFVPAWHAISDPFRALEADWVMNEPAPPPKPDLPEAMIRPWIWWPAEHYESHTPIAQLPEGQVALLRRQDNTLLAAAIDLEPKLLRRPITETVVGAQLVVSQQPDSAKVFPVDAAVIGTPLFARAYVDSRPALIGIEFPAGPSRPAGRARFGIVPPKPLAQMAAGEVAISDPVLLQVGLLDQLIPNEPDSALRRMAGSTRVPSAGRLGVYWETYGLKPTDSVEVAVWIERYTRQGIARRFGARLSLAQDLNTPVAVTWQEPQVGHRAHVLAGPVPVVSRTVTLDVSKLPGGDYWLDVVVRLPGHDPVRGRRSFIISR